MLVVDASVAVKWFLVEPGDREALTLLESDEPLIAPELVVAEVVNVVWKRLMAGYDRSGSGGRRAPRAAELVAEVDQLCEGSPWAYFQHWRCRSAAVRAN